jgi:hypothetical protein
VASQGGLSSMELVGVLAHFKSLELHKGIFKTYIRAQYSTVLLSIVYVFKTYI